MVRFTQRVGGVAVFGHPVSHKRELACRPDRPGNDLMVFTQASARRLTPAGAITWRAFSPRDQRVVCGQS